MEHSGSCPHSGLHCMGLSASLAGYELCDFGQVTSLYLSFPIYKWNDSSTYLLGDHDN